MDGFSDSESDDFTDTFELKPQFEGEHGRELLKLQKKHAGDSRFVIDETFNTQTENHVEKVEEGSTDMLKEKENLLEILRGVVPGSQNETRKEGLKSALYRDVPRYDPDIEAEERKTKIREKKKLEKEKINERRDKPPRDAAGAKWELASSWNSVKEGREQGLEGQPSFKFGFHPEADTNSTGNVMLPHLDSQKKNRRTSNDQEEIAAARDANFDDTFLWVAQEDMDFEKLGGAFRKDKPSEEIEAEYTKKRKIATHDYKSRAKNAKRKIKGR